MILVALNASNSNIGGVFAIDGLGVERLCCTKHFFTNPLPKGQINPCINITDFYPAIVANESS